MSVGVSFECLIRLQVLLTLNDKHTRLNIKQTPEPQTQTPHVNVQLTYALIRIPRPKQKAWVHVSKALNMTRLCHVHKFLI